MCKMVDKHKKQIILTIIKAIAAPGFVILIMFYLQYWSRPPRVRDQFWGDLPLYVFGAILYGIFIVIWEIKKKKNSP
jgi:hypothetical protein